MIKCVFTYISIFLKVYMKIDLNNALNNISEKKKGLPLSLFPIILVIRL